MLRHRLAIVFFLIGVVVPLLQTVYYAPRLPERVASHFGPSGAANGWMTRGTFLSFYIGMAVFVALLFGGLGFLLEHTPDELVNLPNKEYWLAPERRRATFAAIRAEMLGFGAATMLLLVGTMQVVLETNRKGGDQMGTTALLMVLAYLVYTGFWCAGLVRRFALPR